MKLPINFNDSYPLTLGVSDDYFTLSTRLKRLGRAPMQPRRRAAWLLSGALLLSFGAVVPIELTARAQNATEKAAAKTRTFSGIVRDYAGKPVAGAQVTAMSWESNDKVLPTATTDINGQFVMRNVEKEDGPGNVFIDAGARGFGSQYLYDKFEGVNFKLAQPVSLTLTMQDSNGKPVPNLEVKLWSVGSKVDSPWNFRDSFRQKFRATTNARGQVTFRALPRGKVVSFSIHQKKREYAQLNVVDHTIALPGADNRATIRLQKGVTLTGRVTLPNGKAAAQFWVTTRRISAAEARGETGMAAADYTQLNDKTDAQGNYRVENLQPGNYYVWVTPAQKAPGVVGIDKKLPLTRPLNRLDFALPRGGLVQGVIVSQKTGKPVRGQTLILDSPSNREAAISDLRGYFRFRAVAGAAHLEVHANGTNSPPPGFALPAQSKFDFTLKDGEKREFKIALPETIAIKPIGGIVLNADGAAAANASVTYRAMSGWHNSRLQTIVADEKGRFVLPTEISKDAPVQLFADLGEQTTRSAVIALSGDEVQLQLAPDAWASLSGQIVDENKKPLAGAKITIHTLVGNYGLNPRQTTSDSQGRYRFEHLRPGTGTMAKALKDGYSYDSQMREVVDGGQSLTLDMTLRRASKTLSGTLLTEQGNPASGYQIWADGQNRSQSTRKDGKFFLSQVLAGPIKVQVTAPQGGRSWQPFNATGGDKNIVLRLSKARSNNWSSERNTRETVAASLVGKAAPAIQATRWSNNKPVSLASLKGQTVLLIFGDLARDSGGEKAGLARALQGRARVVGVQWNWESRAPKRNADADELGRKLGIPIAIDAVTPTKTFSGWQTTAAYGNARYAVIGRDGKVLYAGDEVKRAIELATAN